MDDTDDGFDAEPAMQRGQTLYRRPGAAVEEAPRATPGAAALEIGSPDSTDPGFRARPAAAPMPPPDSTRLGAPSSSHPTVGGDAMPASPAGPPRDGLGTMFGMHVLDEDVMPDEAPEVESNTIFGVRGAMDEAHVPGESDLDLRGWSDDTDVDAAEGSPKVEVSDDLGDPLGRADLDAPAPSGTDPGPRPGGAPGEGAGAGDWLDDISAWLKGEPDEDGGPPEAAAAADDAPPEDRHERPTAEVNVAPGPERPAPARDTQPVEGAAMIMRRPKGGRKRKGGSGPAAIGGYGAHAAKTTLQDDVGTSAATAAPRRRRPSDDVRVPETVSLDARYSGASETVDPSKLPPGIRRPGEALAFADTGAMPALGDPRSGGPAPANTVPDAAFSVIEDIAPPKSDVPKETPPPRAPSTDPIGTDDTLLQPAAARTPELEAALAEAAAGDEATAGPKGTGLTQQLQGLLGDRDPRAGTDDIAPAEADAAADVPAKKDEGGGLSWGPIVAVAVVVIGALVGAAIALGVLIDG